MSVAALRGFAALAVVLFHVRVELWVGWKELRGGSTEASDFDHVVGWLSTPLPFMGSGVMLFFLISGFCIALPYAGETGRPLRWREYIVRRFGRIYPPYLATLGVCLLLERVYRMESHPGAFVSTMLMVQNYTTGQVASNPSLWSVPVEVELYLLFPVVHLLLRRWGVRAVLLLTGIISLVALGGYLAGVDSLSVNAAKFWVLWASGAVLAEWYKLGRLTSPSLPIMVSGLLALGIAVGGELVRIPAAVLHFGYGYAYFILLWCAIVREARWRGFPVRIVRLLVWLGAISYSLYLVHFPFFRIAGLLWVRQFETKPVNFLVPLVFASVVIPVGWMFYRLVESPSHRWAKAMARHWG